MLKLASIEVFFAVFAIFGKETIWDCYDNYQKCIPESNETDHVNVNKIGSHNIIEFCFNHTQNILPCLATKVISRLHKLSR